MIHKKSFLLTLFINISNPNFFEDHQFLTTDIFSVRTYLKLVILIYLHGTIIIVYLMNLWVEL